MRRILKISFLLSLVILTGTSCRNGGAASKEKVKHFRVVSVPSVYTSQEDIAEYLSIHYWEDFIGVPDDEVEKALADYIGLLSSMPVAKAGKAMEVFFDRISAEEQKDTSLHVYIKMTQLVSKYLYDPNSPLRNEDIYLPFVRKMAESPLTSKEMKPAYEYEAKSCACCQGGTVAPDFRFRTIKGRTYHLYDIKADYTMLFFSNPGCTACKGIIDEVQNAKPLQDMIGKGSLAVVNVYIDEDLKAWREYEHNYPASWHSGYDPDYVIRGESLYPVRAIPSLYLLDKDKRIIMKDAPTERVITFLSTLKTN